MKYRVGQVFTARIGGDNHDKLEGIIIYNCLSWKIMVGHQEPSGTLQGTVRPYPTIHGKQTEHHQLKLVPTGTGIWTDSFPGGSTVNPQ